MSGNITTQIKCENLAPIENLSKTIQSESLKLVIFANNGTGKSFISGAFQLTEPRNDSLKDDEGNVETDKYITMQKNNAFFSFKLAYKQETKENIEIRFNRGKVPEIQRTNYIYHTFNQYYIDKNIRAYGYQKDSNISGYIKMGAENIDIEEEQNELESKTQEKEDLAKRVNKNVKDHVSKRLNDIPYITKIKEYKFLNYDSVLKNINNPWGDVTKTFDQLLKDYHTVKAVPEDLESIKSVKFVDYNKETFDQIIENLKAEYTLNDISQEFRQKIRDKEYFIEEGVKLKGEQNICPFCEQELNDAAQKLIEKYTRYIEGREAKTKKALEGCKKSVNNLLENINFAYHDNIQKIHDFNNYKEKYIPSMKDVALEEFEIDSLTRYLNDIISKLDEKIKNLSKAQDIESSYVDKTISDINTINTKIQTNNKKINTLNERKDKTSEENREIRREMCKVVLNELIDNNKEDIKKIYELEKLIKGIYRRIKEKREQSQVSKKAKVADTLKTLLSSFFADKYAFDEDTFTLKLYDHPLQSGQVRDVLSDGEKNVIAFAYYLADIHTRVETEEDYEKLFFVIDDPISSMDFNHLYSLCGIIRNLNILTDTDYVRFLILTHNIEFMRVLISNDIANQGFILKSNQLMPYSKKLTIPYLYHLVSIYKISKRKEDPDYTTCNSIRHIIESLVKFEYLDTSTGNVEEFIRSELSQNEKIYTAIQDLSHGAWRDEQPPLTEDDYVEICDAVIQCIRQKHAGQIAYCEQCT